MKVFDIEGKELRSSNDVVIFKNGKHIALFHRFKLKKAYGELSLLNFFKRFESRLNTSNLSNMEKVAALKLYCEGFLVEKDKDYVGYLRHFARTKPLDIFFMFLFTTDRCNFQCKYCYIEKRFCKNHVFNNLTPETMKKGVDLFFDYASKSRQKTIMLVFYGGEPLLNKELSMTAFDYIEENKNKLRNDQKLKQNIVTNGSLIDEDVINKIVDINIRTSVSIDGPKKVHDLMRIYSSGRGTYEDVIKNYYRLKKAGVEHLGISMTVGKHNIGNFKDCCEFIATELEPRGVKFNFISPINSRGNPYACNLKSNLNKVLDGFDVLRDYGIFEDTIGRKLEHFINEEYIYDTTPSTGYQMTLFSDGSIGPSEALWGKGFSVDINKVKRLEQVSIFNKWNRIATINKPKCYKCPAIGLCGGGRPADALIKYGSLMREDGTCCEYVPGVLEWLIWSYAKKSGLA